MLIQPHGSLATAVRLLPSHSIQTTFSQPLPMCPSCWWAWISGASGCTGQFARLPLSTLVLDCPINKCNHSASRHGSCLCEVIANYNSRPPACPGWIGALRNSSHATDCRAKNNHDQLQFTDATITDATIKYEAVTLTSTPPFS